MPALQRAGRGLRPGRRSRPGRCATATSTSSTARRSGRRWPSFSKFGILIARTDPDAPKHKGISYFICPMDAPGIEIRPIIEMTGAHTFNEVFFTDVRHPGREPRRRGERGLGAGQGHARQRAGVAVVGRRAVGHGPDRRRPARPRRGRGRRAPTRSLRQRLGRAAHRGRDPRPHPAAHGHRPHQGRAAGRRRRRSARSSPTSTASGSWAWPRTWPAPAGMLDDSGPAGRAGRPVALRLPVRARAHRRRRHRRGAAQHHRRAGARPAARRRPTPARRRPSPRARWRR